MLLIIIEIACELDETDSNGMCFYWNAAVSFISIDLTLLNTAKILKDTLHDNIINLDKPTLNFVYTRETGTEINKTFVCRKPVLCLTQLKKIP